MSQATKTHNQTWESCQVGKRPEVKNINAEYEVVSSKLGKRERTA